MGESIKINDIVKYQNDIYIVKETKENIATIVGYSYRLIKQVNISYLTL